MVRLRRVRPCQHHSLLVGYGLDCRDAAEKRNSWPEKYAYPCERLKTGRLATRAGRIPRVEPANLCAAARYASRQTRGTRAYSGPLQSYGLFATHGFATH